MAQTIFDTAAREALIQRLHLLTPKATARWGKMSPPSMVSHLIESCRLALGDLPVKPVAGPLSYFPINWLVIHLLPWPRSAPTAPELLARAPLDWEGDLLALVDLMRRTGQKLPGEEWPPHPAFGGMSGKDWGVLIHRHVDHHFQQFGI
jgi:hypothetical protein